MRTGGFFTQTTDFVLFIGFEVAFEPFNMAVAFERKDVRRQTIEEETVVRDNHGATGEAFQRLFKRGQRFGIKIVGRFVEQEDVATLLQHLRHMHAVAFTA